MKNSKYNIWNCITRYDLDINVIGILYSNILCKFDSETID